LTGSCPLSWTLASTPQTPSTKTKRLQQININHSEIPIGQSIASTTRPSPGPRITFDTHEQFTNHDIEELNTQLENNLLPTDSGTRLSRSITSKQSSRSITSKQSSRSTIGSERSNLSNVSDKPWKP